MMMNEQQRIFLTVMLCMGIFLGWQFFQAKYNPAPAKPAPLAQTRTSPDQGPAAHPRDPEPAGAAAAEKPQLAAVAKAPPASRPFETALLRGSLSNQDAGLSELQLLNYHERAKQQDAAALVDLVAGPVAQAQIRWNLGSGAAPALEFEHTDSGLLLKGDSPAGFHVTVLVTPRPHDYALDYILRATNTGSSALPAGATVVMGLTEPEGSTPGGGGLFSGGTQAPALGALCEANGSVERKDAKNVAKKPWVAEEPARFAGLDRQYFVVAVAPQDESTGTCSVRGEDDVLRVSYAFPSETVAPGAAWEKRFSLYAGPKRDNRLAAVSSHLTEVIDYNVWHLPLGFLARPMVFLLGLFHGWTASWGVAIALLTLLVKLVLFPVTYRSAMSARKMQVLKPEIDRLKAQFGNDNERMQMEQMKLFRERGVNPLGGCLPMLAQMPVWLALYRMLSNAVDLYRQPFLWLPDLTAKEPFPILALAIGALSVLQQRLTPVAVDNQQAKVMMYVMPVMFTVFMVALPSGLVLYILVNVILSIIQQLAINRRTVAA